MKSKTRRISKNTQQAKTKSFSDTARTTATATNSASGSATAHAPVTTELNSLDSLAGEAMADTLAVGHQPPLALNPQDQTLFLAFQSNLLSLISHELRTPLTGILNALGVLESRFQAQPTEYPGSEAPGLAVHEMIAMALENAQQLRHSLVALLDLAAIESGTFHVRLREVNLYKVAKGRFEAQLGGIQNQGFTMKWDEDPEIRFASPVLADPQRLGQAVDLCLRILASRAVRGSEIQVRISSRTLDFSAPIAPGKESAWDSSWSQSLVGLHGGMNSPYSAFGGVMQSEEAFLTRQEEGLGSEFLLIHEIVRHHKGQFSTNFQIAGNRIHLTISLPQLGGEESLQTVLVSRAYSSSSELGSFAVILMKFSEPVDLEKARDRISRCLYRSTDSVYLLDGRSSLALILDDCKCEDTLQIVERVSEALRQAQLPAVHFGSAHCPGDCLDPLALLGIAQKRLASHLQKQ